MSKGKLRTLLVFAIIAFPFAIYLFLRILSDPVYTTLPYEYNVSPQGDTTFFQAPEFTLIDQNGDPFTRDSLKDKVYVISFFCLGCNELATKVLNGNLRQIDETAGAMDEVRLLSISTDPENDSLQALSIYAGKQEAQPPNWRFATGSMKDILTLGRDGLGIPAFRDFDETLKPITAPEVCIVDKEGKVRGYYVGTDLVEIENLKQDLRALLVIEYSQDFKSHTISE